MSEEELRSEIRQLRQALHGVGKPWYARSPFKEYLAHTMSVVTAVGIGLVVHKWTGAPVVIEAKNAAEIAPAAAAVASVAAVTAEMDRVELLLDAATPSATAVSAAPVVKRAVKPAAQAPATIAAAPAAVPPPAAATAKPTVVREVLVGGVRVGD